MGKKRGPIKNLDAPLGQFAQFLLHSLERRGWSADEFHAEMKANGFTRTDEAVKKWLTGSNGPRLGDLHFVALALGYDDWLSLIAAVAKFHKRTK